MTPTALHRSAGRRLALFVGGNPDALDVVEPVLDGKDFVVEFVAEHDDPYATIAALKPDLVVVGLDLNDNAAFQLLTMLRLDPATAAIPVLSYVRDAEVSSFTPPRTDHNPARLPAVSATRTQRH